MAHAMTHGRGDSDHDGSWHRTALLRRLPSERPRGGTGSAPWLQMGRPRTGPDGSGHRLGAHDLALRRPPRPRVRAGDDGLSGHHAHDAAGLRVRHPRPHQEAGDSAPAAFRGRQRVPDGLDGGRVVQRRGPRGRRTAQPDAPGHRPWDTAPARQLRRRRRLRLPPGSAGHVRRPSADLARPAGYEREHEDRLASLGADPLPPPGARVRPAGRRGSSRRTGTR